MKIRSNFVSNSSSSSFVLAIRNDHCKVCGRGSNVLDKIKQHIKSHDCGETELRPLNEHIKYANGLLKELKKRTYKEHHWKHYSENELKEEKRYAEETIKKLEMCLFEIDKYKSDKDYTVILCEVDYRDDYLSNMLKNEKDVKIIYVEAI